MSEVSERRRKLRQKAGENGDSHVVKLLNVPGADGEIQAKVVDSNDVGLGVETPCALQINAVLIVHGRLSHDGAISKARARVVRCEASPGGYRSGLAFETGPAQNGKSGEAVPDYYEVLQISPNADPDMIHRVYRLLAQRYHPDNTASGDEKAFRTITDAYEVLS